MTETSQAPAGDAFTVQRMGNEEGPYTFMDLQTQVGSGTMRWDTMVRKGSGTWFAAREIPGLFSDKEWLTTLLFSFFVGWFGIDRFYLGHTELGVYKLISLGGLGIWWIIDLILIVTGSMKDSNGLPLRR